MNDNVVGLLGGPLPGQPVACVVEALEELLASARSGNIRALAFVTVNRGGTVDTSWEQPEAAGENGISLETHGLGAGILTLAWRYGQATVG